MAFASSFVRDASREAGALQISISDRYHREMMLAFRLLQEHNAEFGYRTANEVSRFIHFYHSLVGSEEETSWFDGAMDAAIVQKFLPKTPRLSPQSSKGCCGVWRGFAGPPEGDWTMVGLIWM